MTPAQRQEVMRLHTIAADKLHRFLCNCAERDHDAWQASERALSAYLDRITDDENAVTGRDADLPTAADVRGILSEEK